MIRIYMRDFADIQPEPREQHFRVDDESARAKFGARITRFFKNQDGFCEVRSNLPEMQRGGKP